MRPASGRILLIVAFSLSLGGVTFLQPRKIGAEETKYASAALVESAFRGKSFFLGDDTRVAVVRALDWDKDRTVKLPYWLGTGNAAPPTLRPKMSGYYVISEAYIVRSLGGREWLIRAGSQLQKPDAVFVTRRTHYKNTGVILPTIVQYAGTRNFTRTDGTKIDIAVLQEVSIPMKWTKPGKVPTMYANFFVRP